MATERVAVAVGEDGVATLRLSGSMRFEDVGRVREALRSALAAGLSIRIDLEETGPWDLAGLQVLISAVAAGRSSGGLVRLVQVPESCRDVAERAGLGAWLRDVVAPR